jgi:hypothetical protein
MPTTFLDLLSTPAVQEAEQQARVQQQAGFLSVQPRPVLRDIVQEARQRYVAGQELDLGARRLRLAEREARAERRQAPFAIGLGALDLGVNVLGGLRDRRLLQEERARAARMEDLQTQTLDALRQTAAERLRRLRERTQRFQGFLNQVPPEDLMPQ